MKHSKGENIFNIFNIAFMALLALITLYPFWHVLMTSVMTYSELLKSNIRLFTLKPDFSAYAYIFSNESLLNGLNISVITTIAGTAYQLFMTGTLAFALSKPDLPGRKFMLFFVIFTMFFGGGLIPYYLLIKNLGLIDNLLVLVVPGAISTYNLIIVKTFFENIPKDLEESAIIDGAGYIRVFFWIIIPLSLPIIATIGLFSAVGQWNNWFTSMLYLNKKSSWPLALVLRDMLINDPAQSKGSSAVNKAFMLGESIKMAVVIVSVVPVMVIYPFVQKYFVKGVMLGSVKS